MSGTVPLPCMFQKWNRSFVLAENSGLSFLLKEKASI